MKSGSACNYCSTGTWRTQRTKTVGFRRVRYLVCDECKSTDKEILKLDAVGRIILPGQFYSVERTILSHNDSGV